MIELTNGHLMVEEKDIKLFGLLSRFMIDNAVSNQDIKNALSSPAFIDYLLNNQS